MASDNAKVLFLDAFDAQSDKAMKALDSLPLHMPTPQGISGGDPGGRGGSPPVTLPQPLQVTLAMMKPHRSSFLMVVPRGHAWGGQCVVT